MFTNPRLRYFAPEAPPTGDPAPAPAPVDPPAPLAPAPTDPPAPVSDPAPVDPNTPPVIPDDAPEWVKDPTKFDPVAAWRKQQNQAADLAAAKAKTDAAVAAAIAQATQEQTDKLAKALGLKPDDTPADPQELVTTLTTERDAATKTLREYQQRDAIRAASDLPEVQADSELLTPWLLGSGQLATLDQAASDYPAQVAALVKDAVTKYPQAFRRAQVAPRSSAEVPPTGTPPTGELTVDEVRKEFAANRNR